MYTSARMLREQLIQVQKQRDTLLDMIDSLRRYIVDLEGAMDKVQRPCCPCCTDDGECYDKQGPPTLHNCARDAYGV